MICGFFREIRVFRFPPSKRLVVLALALAVVSIMWACSAPNDNEPVAKEQGPATQTPAATQTPPATHTRAATPTPAANLAALLETIGPAVAELRGLRQWDVPASLLTREMLEEKLGIGVRRRVSGRGGRA